MCQTCYVGYEDITCPECPVNKGGEELCEHCFEIKLARLDLLRERNKCKYFYKNDE